MGICYNNEIDDFDGKAVLNSFYVMFLDSLCYTFLLNIDIANGMTLNNRYCKCVI
jgi:hypothetical protein